ncbi:MAG: hypothetical protein JW893_08775 [Candidatus Omnitrophica bacterium]|nr:hypothetical protein [Candidatus Omnitrophota bacterium]
MMFLIVILLLAIAALAPFVPYLVSGMSFYTFHALSGLMALKYLSAQCFLSGQYPLWNPFLIGGVPFHTGIGVGDPLLLPFTFLKEGPDALIATAYLALFLAGIGMFLYLRLGWKLSHSSALLGGILYLSNPFFTATSHELPFMAPPVYLPYLFLVFGADSGRYPFSRALASGLFLGLTFLSGNLESYLLVFLVFASCVFIQTLLAFIEKRSLKTLMREWFKLVICVVISLCFTAYDLLPTFEMMRYSYRSLTRYMNEVFIFYGALLVGTIACLMVIEIFRRRGILNRKGLWFFAVGLFLLFAIGVDWERRLMHFDTNIFYPSLSMVMHAGQDAFHLLLNAVKVPRDILTDFMKPRFIFYLQHPTYIFTMGTFLLFLLGWTRTRVGWGWGIWALFLAVFPYSWLPNPYHYLLGLDVLTYQRHMFAFFFILSFLCAHGFERLKLREGMDTILEKPWSQTVLRVMAGISFLGVVGFCGLSLAPWDPAAFGRQLIKYSDEILKTHWISRAWGYLSLQMMLLPLFSRIVPYFFFFGAIKLLALGFAALSILRRNRTWIALFYLTVFLEVLIAWPLYNFQNADIQTLKSSAPEIQFLKHLGFRDRVSIIPPSWFDKRNFYDQEYPVVLGWNMPVYFQTGAISDSTINIPLALLRRFLEAEPGHTTTPFNLMKFPNVIDDLMGANYLLSAEPVRDPDYERLVLGEVYSVYRNKRALPPFYFVAHLEQTQESQIAMHMENGDWDPWKITYAEAAAPFNENFSAEILREDPRIQVGEEDYHKVVIRVSSAEPQFLATTRAFYPRWRARVDGREAPIVKSNFYFQGLFLRPGSHEIQLIYDPGIFWAGLTIALSGLLLTLTVWIVERNRTKSHIR